MKGTEMLSEIKHYIIDSCGWIEYLSDGPLADSFSRYIEQATPKEYFTPSIVIYEVYKRLRTIYSEEEAMKAIAHIKYLTTIIDMTESIALKAADLSFERKIPMADSIILASSLMTDSTIVTCDSDFKDMDGIILFAK